MAIISRKYPYFSEDENGVWKHYNSMAKVLVEPSQKYIDENPELEEEKSQTTEDIIFDAMAAAYIEGVQEA